MIPYVFVAAAAFAVFPILILFKINVEKLKKDPRQQGKVQTNMMLGVAISEAIPIILIIYGFSKLAPVSDVSTLYVPGIIIVFFMLFAAFFIFMQRKVDVEENSKSAVNNFSMISLMLTMAIPLISVISLFLMVP
ncbi:MAG: hypothetical protein ACQEWU_12925 [Bacillota bacterium]|uniref:Uncharacterized protein n=1 Tax=Virgibacillus salarius TaxID=447199 RepID=A0A941ICA3_9BACI|nr:MULTISPECIES: hypothetical protein [Bacillaceae]NAZ09991.1 hypothetical protein [Agaribacter marinus]MBR7797281.1 hypothetical protein [Virgibacillus salarius]MCC2250609.1 hypothetical protein [Virgibacillus sp. AGTR]MDY7046303.1 hypothetical protein [Virgibacillus sp. M23]QRZ18474.1 hypothetical protein JUJ52_01610 [Virgibacillus sp. AGTR]